MSARHINIIDWIRGTGKWKTIKKNKHCNRIEYDYISQWYNLPESNQWTSSFGELLVKEILVYQNNTLSIQERTKLPNGLVSDLETPNAVIEVKTRNYTTTGTAGEKIFSALWNYADVYTLTSKKVYIILVGYQEQEARRQTPKFNISCAFISKTKKNILDFFWINYKVRFIFLSELLDKDNFNRFNF